MVKQLKKTVCKENKINDRLGNFFIKITAVTYK